MDTSTLTARVKERVLPISELVESLGDRLVDQETLEEAVTELTTVISGLPSDFLSLDEVKLLLQFARGVDASNEEFLCLDLISFLINCSSFSPLEDSGVFYHLTEDVDVQARTQKERHKIHGICQHLLPKASAELRANPRRVGEALIRSITGEADPRCLLIVFNLIKIYCGTFNVKNEVDIAFQLFDVLSVYYPLQYKPKSDGDVTFEELSSLCRSTLICCPLFSKVFYMFVADKLQDPDDSYEDKMQICQLLLEAIPSFDKEDYFESLEAIFDGLRTAAVDPRYKGDMSELSESLSKIIETLKNEDPLYLKAAVDSALQNLEPFVVQPAMGLMDKALSYLHPFAEHAVGFEKTVLSRVFAWLIEKIQSPVEPTCEGGLEMLQNWAHVSPLETRASVLSIYSDSLLSALDVAEKTCPALAATVRDVFLPVFAEAGFFDNVKNIALDLMESADFDAEANTKKTSVTSLISTLASKNRSQSDQLILEFEERIKDKTEDLSSNLNFIYCAAVLDEGSWEKYRERILSYLTGEKYVNCLATDVPMAERVTISGLSIVPKQILEAVKTINFEDKDLLRVAQLVQRLTSCLPPSEDISDAAELPHFFLSVAMSGIPKKIDVAYSKATSLTAKKTLVFARACSSTNSIDASEKWSRTQELKGRLVQGQTVAEGEIEEYFSKIQSGEIDATDLFDFEPPFGCPEAIKVKKSPLWRQRLLHFLLPKLVSVALASGDSAEPLISLLPSIFRFLKQCDPSLAEFYGETLRPLTSKALENLGAYDSGLVQVLLPLLVEDLGPLSDEAGKKFGKMLIDMVEKNTKEPSILLSALAALDILSKKATRGVLRYLLPAILKKTTEAMLSPSRHVRAKAAAIKKTWTARSGTD